ncbi:HEPN domain-containing protein [Candidatus Bathyarchaeota archaeon]|nr:HEPN domain-containing protein [Candidatus Bathyarchaeota archaeon]MBS7626908.1 HEPN domain-containing protein [Candidatus Bathyarchaeota archaeon]
MVERSRDWLDQSQGDLDNARNDLRSGFYEWACFSAQQSAEKAVKAVFQKIGAEAWGHSVFDLLSNLESRIDIERDLLDYALELDKAYIPTWYPNVHPSSSPRRRYTKKEAERLIEYAERIFRFCESVLSKI